MLSMIFQITYKSTISLDLSEDDLMELMAQAIQYNARMEITGALITNELEFYQVLEGKSQDITALMTKIKKDKRHSEVQIITERLIKQRDFDNWSMAYVNTKQINQQDKLAFDKLMLNDASTLNDVGTRQFVEIITRNL